MNLSRLARSICPWFLVLTLLAPGRGVRASDDATGAQEEPRTDERVVLKLMHGTFWGGLAGFAAGAGGGALFAIGDPVGFNVPIGVIAGGFLGSVAGSTFGVYKVDPQDRLIIPMAGSLAGVVAGMLILPLRTGGDDLYSLFWPLVACPVVGSTIASEVWRGPTATEITSKRQAPRVSLGLVPDRRLVWGIITLRL